MTYTVEQIREAVNLVIGDDGKRADEVIDVLETDVDQNTQHYLRSKYDYPKKPETSWKDKRIDAMNKIIKGSPRMAKILSDRFVDEYNAVIGSEASNKQQYKKERILKS